MLQHNASDQERIGLVDLYVLEQKNKRATLGADVTVSHPGLGSVYEAHIPEFLQLQTSEVTLEDLTDGDTDVELEDLARALLATGGVDRVVYRLFLDSRPPQLLATNYQFAKPSSQTPVDIRTLRTNLQEQLQPYNAEPVNR